MPLLEMALAEIRFGRVHASRRDIGGRGRLRHGLIGPGGTQDVFVGAGIVAPAFDPDGVLPLAYARFHPWWAGLTAPRPPAPTTAPSEESPGKLGAPERLEPGTAAPPPLGRATAIVGTPGSRYH